MGKSPPRTGVLILSTESQVHFMLSGRCPVWRVQPVEFLVEICLKCALCNDMSTVCLFLFGFDFYSMFLLWELAVATSRKPDFIRVSPADIMTMQCDIFVSF